MHFLVWRDCTTPRASRKHCEYCWMSLEWARYYMYNLKPTCSRLCKCSFHVFEAYCFRSCRVSHAHNTYRNKIMCMLWLVVACLTCLTCLTCYGMLWHIWHDSSKCTCVPWMRQLFLSLSRASHTCTRTIVHKGNRHHNHTHTLPNTQAPGPEYFIFISPPSLRKILKNCL